MARHRSRDASDMMLSASVFALADEALDRGDAIEVVAGMLAGALFFSRTSRIIDERGWTLGFIAAIGL